jgi:hypothetical protein
MMKWIDSTPLWVFAIAAILFALAPFGQTPHFVEKWRMLFGGVLRRPIDWFDLVMHTAPLLLLLVKVFRMRGA